MPYMGGDPGAERRGFLPKWLMRRRALFVVFLALFLFANVASLDVRSDGGILAAMGVGRGLKGRRRGVPVHG